MFDCSTQFKSCAMLVEQSTYPFWFISDSLFLHVFLPHLKRTCFPVIPGGMASNVRQEQWYQCLQLGHSTILLSSTSVSFLARIQYFLAGFSSILEWQCNKNWLFYHPTSRLNFSKDVISSNNFYPVERNFYGQNLKKIKCQRIMTDSRVKRTYFFSTKMYHFKDFILFYACKVGKKIALI